jgi:ADP-dependent NAD(P)H-hydrate dehydratase / NAD(P)H-hydrate epimerase
MMLRLVAAREMQALDRAAVEERGIPGVALMENAGRGIVAAMERQLGSLSGLSPLVVCGKGNNGGDGFVVTRLLLEKGARPDCILLGKSSELRGDAAANWRRLGHIGLTVVEAESAADARTLFSGRRHIVDAIFGTGLTRAPSGLPADVVRLINASGAHVTSVDLPSGLDSDTGIQYDPCIRADLTVTMALPKLGLWLYPGRALVGRLEVVDIGTPADLSVGGDKFLIDAEAVRQGLPKRRPDGNKGTFGTALIVAGSRGFSGAVCLAGMAAVRSGCGLVRLAIPSGIADIVESRCLEPVKVCLPQTDAEAIGTQALSTVVALAARQTLSRSDPASAPTRRRASSKSRCCHSSAAQWSWTQTGSTTSWATWLF